MPLVGMRAMSIGAHSLRIGGATAAAHCGAAGDDIMLAGRWNSDAYLRYVRERRSHLEWLTSAICSADSHDVELADFVQIDDFEFDLEDEE